MNVNYLWNNGNVADWEKGLAGYYDTVKSDHMAIEKELNALSDSGELAEQISKMNVQEFYKFLYEKYFFWKYTAPNRLATTRMNLRKYETYNCMDELGLIYNKIMNMSIENTKQCLTVVSSIKGLGMAGASGLLALMYPRLYGTVDQFVVNALLKISDLSEHSVVSKMKPEGLKLSDAAVLIEIYRYKAQELNEKFMTDFWTPRKIDMVLWSVDR